MKNITQKHTKSIAYFRGEYWDTALSGFVRYLYSGQDARTTRVS
jgi:hypothetical protein